MSKTVYATGICASREDLEPLLGCMLVDSVDGADEDGKEFVTLKFFDPASMKLIRLSIGEDSSLSLSGLEKN